MSIFKKKQTNRKAISRNKKEIFKNSFRIFKRINKDGLHTPCLSMNPLYIKKPASQYSKK